MQSRRSATKTFEYLATFTNAAQRDRGVLAREQLGFPARPALAAASGS